MLSCTQGKASTIIISLVRFPNTDSMSTIATRDADLMMGRGIKIKSAISERELLPSIIGRKEKRGGKKRMKEKKSGTGGETGVPRARARGEPQFICRRTLDPSNPAALFACVL